jgi:hypothetical protein
MWLLVMIIAGARWQRVHRDLEVVVLRDISLSTANVPQPAGSSLRRHSDEFFASAASTDYKPAADRIGLVDFAKRALVSSLPSEKYQSNASAISDKASEAGTNLASALNMGMACFSGTAMKRLIIVSDGNFTAGDWRSSLSAASAAGVAVDVIPLEFKVHHDVLVDRIAAPTHLYQGEAYAIDVILRSTNAKAVEGRLTVSQQGSPLDLNPDQPGIQSSIPVTLRPLGPTPVHLKLPPATERGLNDFHAVFEPAEPADDAVSANNIADALTFVTGRGKVLYVDQVADDQGRLLADALTSKADSMAELRRIRADEVPRSVVDLQTYDAIILANIPRGPGGLDAEQERAVVSYVRDSGGGLLVIGGPEALGAGAGPAASWKRFSRWT